MSQTPFAFGKNWKAFLEGNFRQELVDESARYLAAFLGAENVQGKSFLDVGCGSGLHSLAALQLGASQVTSIDVDPDSVACCSWLQERHGSGVSWRVMQGSLLDAAFLETLPSHDVVYCWGVAHHTGNMEEALEHLAQRTKSGGLLYLAIYNKVPGRRGSSMWYKIKKTYNHVPPFGKMLMEWVYVTGSFMKMVFHLQNPFAFMRAFAKKRGMSWKTDLIDWLGGFPYEYASAEEIFHFYQKRGFTLENLKTTNYIGCNQFLFRKH